MIISVLTTNSLSSQLVETEDREKKGRRGIDSCESERTFAFACEGVKL